MTQLRSLAITLSLAAVPLAACGGDDDPSGLDPCEGVTGTCTRIEPGASSDDVLAAFLQAQPGDTIGFAAGRYELTGDLSMSVDNVAIRGAGPGDGGTVLSFGDSTGAQGILITGDHSTVQDLAVINTPGDAIKWEGVDGVVSRNVRIDWEGPPGGENGAYGLYPVQCQNVLIENSEVRGASDAGIYVGQSDNIIVRNSLAHENVAGIEIENSTRADVYGNTATKNTGGLLVFSLPGLQVANGAGTRVYDNEIFDNNTVNFAPQGNIVGDVPTGSGIILLAGHGIEIFGNRIENHASLQIGVASYYLTMRPFDDPDYDPFSDTISIHDNEIIGAPSMPTGPLGFLVTQGMLELGQTATTIAVPPVIWDGAANPAMVGGDGELTAEFKICSKNNTIEGFANLHVPLGEGATAAMENTAHACDLAPLPAVTLP